MTKQPGINISKLSNLIPISIEYHEDIEIGKNITDYLIQHQLDKMDYCEDYKKSEK